MNMSSLSSYSSDPLASSNASEISFPQSDQLFRSFGGRESLSFETNDNYRSVGGDVDVSSNIEDFSSGAYSFDHPFGSTKPHELLNPKHSAFSSAFSMNEECQGVALPPEIPGGYVEPLYHFVSNCSPSQIISTLETALKGHDIDKIFQQKKFRFKCVTYVSGAKLPFFVSVFRAVPHHQQQKFVIEFQRRTGCVIHFSNIYHRLKKECEDRGIVEGSSASATVGISLTASSSQSTSTVTIAQTLSPLPFISDHKPNFDHAKKTIECLLQMASSEYVDIKQNSLQLLSELSKDPTMAHALIEGGGSEWLMSFLSNCNEDIKRCALTGLANLTQQKQEPLCKKIVESGLIHTLALLALQSQTLQIVREASRLLLNLANTLGSVVVNPDVVRHLFDSQDDKTYAHALKLGHLIGISPAPGWSGKNELSMPSFSGY